MIGTELSHYRITGKLGHGGMGEVYRAEDNKLKREVALKVLPQDLAGDPERLARFQREAEVVAGLNHPNIVTLFSVEQEEGIHFLTMELVDGSDLGDMITGVGMGLEQIFDIAIPMADALAAAHERGIIHRDLKPANVMVNGEGRLKILDFGLAKLAADDQGPGEEDATEALTQEGKVMGTVPYMSPEQVQGKPLDARSDIFSMGVILYEMATGGRPFSGETSADLISSILRDNPSSVTELKGELPHHLGRIVRRCLDKDPKRRYQSALDVRNELEDLKQEVASGALHSETVVLDAERRPAKLPGWIPVAVAAVALLAAGFLGWRLLSPSSTPTQRAPQAAAEARLGGEPSIAVLYFDNLSGDQELDWLRSGLTDMLVTDLSQSPDLRVLSTDRLYQILSDMKRLDERITSFEVVREVAEIANADKVILGSFAKLGETIRISIKVQEAATGEILKSDSVDARAQEEIFARVDDLSRDIRQSIRLPERPASVADRDLSEVSTASVAAYKAYVQAEELHFQTREQEAIEYYRQATELDPGFAMAWAKLSTSHGNLGMEEQARGYAEKAMEHLDRLTEAEQAYVEGRYYGRKLDTVGRALETYERAIAAYPHVTSLLNNVGILYGRLGMRDEQIAALEQAIDYGDMFPGTHTALAQAYLATGDTRRAFEVLEAFLKEVPDSISAHQTAFQLHLSLGDIGAAEQDLAKAEEVRPGFYGLLFSHISLAILQEDWERAESTLAQVGELPFPFAKSASAGVGAALAIYRGDFSEALESGRAAVAAWPEPGAGQAGAHTSVAAAYVELGDGVKALEHATQARQQDPGSANDLVAHGYQVLAHQMLGQARRADLVLEEVEQRIDSIPGPSMQSFLHEVRGRLALARRDSATAVDELESAAALIEPYSGWQPRVWFQLGLAYLEEGRDRDAESRFRKITELAGPRVYSPPEYVASHYELARLLERRGDSDGARSAYRTYLSYWGDADRFRDDVEHAESFLAGP